jgi:hypothetical protein
MLKKVEEIIYLGSLKVFSFSYNYHNYNFLLNQNKKNSYIFTSSSESSIINLIVIIAIESLTSKYELTLIQSILICVLHAFVVCFGASYRYSSLLFNESKEVLADSSRNILIVYNRKIDNVINQEFVCLFRSNKEKNSKTIRVEMKYLSPKYASKIGQLFEFYSSNHMSLKESQPQQNASQEDSLISQNNENNYNYKKPELYNFVVNDYYNIGFILTNTIKKHGFKSIKSWVEFRIFPSIDFKTHIYSNINNNPKKTN